MSISSQVFLTEAEAAEYLRVSRSYLRKARCYGGGPRYVRIGKRAIRYRIEDLDAWIDQNTVNP